MALHQQTRAQPPVFRCQTELYCLLHQFFFFILFQEVAERSREEKHLQDSHLTANMDQSPESTHLWVASLTEV